MENNNQNLPIFNDFNDLKLRDELNRGIYCYGYDKPSEIQSKGIYPIIKGHDVIGQAQSGMGKTATYSIGMLEVIDPTVRETQAIVLANTRELASQIENVISNLGKYLKVNISLSVKGVPVKTNIEVLRKRPHIVVGTPGRVYDMIKRGALRTKAVKILVIDEADEMVKDKFTGKKDNQSQIPQKFGFLDQIKQIFQSLPCDVQSVLFSATMPPDFFELTEKFMRDPIKILVEPEQLSLVGIKQYYIDIEENSQKYDFLCDLYNVLEINQAIIYCNSRNMVETLSNKLINDGFRVSYIHGSMTTVERDSKMREFISCRSRILVSTDLLSRGIDVQQISIVINYDIPKSIDNYLHRIGRSGRYGRKGVAINFKTPYDFYKLQSIEKHYGIEIEKMPEDINKLTNFF